MTGGQEVRSSNLRSPTREAALRGGLRRLEIREQMDAAWSRHDPVVPSGPRGGGADVGVQGPELIGTSSQSWEDAAAGAVKLARQTLRDLRVAEVVEQDLDLGDGDSITYRTKLRVSFKYEGGE
ncbi:MAG: dodecin family protein [Acidimicrobiia bacterium]